MCTLNFLDIESFRKKAEEHRTCAGICIVQEYVNKKEANCLVSDTCTQHGENGYTKGDDRCRRIRYSWGSNRFFNFSDIETVDNHSFDQLIFK